MSEQGIYFHVSLPRIAMQRAWPRQSGLFAGRSLSLQPLQTPALPTGWVKLRPRLSGICGSDISLLKGLSSAYMAPLTSFPAVLGHEVLAETIDGAQRVVIDPSLGCVARRLPLCQMCSLGQPDDCLRRTDPGLGAGLLLGYTAKAPGGWSSCMWAPQEQIVPVPSAMPDERAVLTEPAAIVLAGLRHIDWAVAKTVLVVGAGTLGLIAVALISELYPATEVFVLARYAAQQALAHQMGAAHVVARARADRDFEKTVGEPGKSLPGAAPYYPKGFDVVVVAAGSQSALAASVTWVRAGGQLLLLGGVGDARIDWTPIWSRRLRVIGSYGYGESGADTFRAILSLFSVMSQPLESLVTHRFLLGQYRAAVHAVMTDHNVIKAVFTPNPESEN